MQRILPFVVLLLVFLKTPLIRAQPSTTPSTRPAVLQLLLPDEATATVDARDLGKQRNATFDTIEPGETKRVFVSVKFPGGAVEERYVDLEQGQTIPVPVPTPQADKAVAVPIQAIDPVLALALSPGDRYLAIGLDSGAVTVWDLEAGVPIRIFRRHRAPVQTLAFSPDGSQLLSGSADNTAILWDFKTGAPSRTFSHTDQVMCVAFRADGQRILTASMDKSAVMWDATSGQKLQTYMGHTNQVWGVAFSPDGKTVATASLDRNGALWEAETGKQLFNLRGHSDGASCVMFSPDGKTVATGSFDNTAIFWDVESGRRLGRTGRHEIDIYGLTFTPDGKRLLTAARDEIVIMWDVATGQRLRTFLGHNSDVGGAVVSSDGRLMFSCSRDGLVKLWDMATGMELASLITDAAGRRWAVVAPDGLFDASEPGRQLMGFRFVKLAGGNLDQFFAERFTPGLLTELHQGKRPFSTKPLGHAPPPLVRISSPKTRSSPSTLPVSITVEATDQGGGISAVQLLNNGAPVAVKQDLHKLQGASPHQLVFDNILLAPGVNQITATASNGDGSWRSAPSEIELSYPQQSRSKGRLYVIVSGESTALAQALKSRATAMFDRVDLIRVPHTEASRETIEDAIVQVAELTRPQDSLMVLLESRGSTNGEWIEHVPAQRSPAGNELTIDALTVWVSRAPALHRALVLDLNDPSAQTAPASVAPLRGRLERLSREHGVHVAMSITYGDEARGSLSRALIATIPSHSDLTDWFRASVQQVGGQCTTQLSGFPIFPPYRR